MRLLIPVLLTALPATASPVTDGQKLYLDLCAECHADDATGDIGADIRGASSDEIAKNLDNQDTMQGLQVAADEIAAIAAYLATLAD